MGDDSKRSNPQDNPFNQAQDGSTLLNRYDEFGNRIVESAQPPKVSEVSAPIQPEPPVQPTSPIQPEPPVPPAPPPTPPTPPTTVEPEKTVNEVIKEDLSIASQDPAQKPAQNQEVSKSENNLMSKAKSAKTMIAAIVIVFTAGVLLIAGFMIQSQLQEEPITSTNENSTTTEALVKKVADIVDLPIDEAPSQVANVTETTTLPEDNPFRTVARSGDLILIYEQNKTAVLFRPSTGKVVSMGSTKPITDVAGVSSEPALPAE